MSSGEIITKICDEYSFAKSQKFDSIVIVIETSGGDYEISEYQGGFVNGNLDGIYSEIEDIASDMFSLIVIINKDKIEGLRIE